jgi:hypothetical protein
MTVTYSVTNPRLTSLFTTLETKTLSSVMFDCVLICQKQILS